MLKIIWSVFFFKCRKYPLSTEVSKKAFLCPWQKRLVMVLYNALLISYLFLELMCFLFGRGEENVFHQTNIDYIRIFDFFFLTRLADKRFNWLKFRWSSFRVLSPIIILFPAQIPEQNQDAKLKTSINKACMLPCSLLKEDCQSYGNLNFWIYLHHFN